MHVNILRKYLSEPPSLILTDPDMQLHLVTNFEPFPNYLTPQNNWLKNQQNPLDFNTRIYLASKRYNEYYVYLMTSTKLLRIITLYSILKFEWYFHDLNCHCFISELSTGKLAYILLLIVYSLLLQGFTDCSI